MPSLAAPPLKRPLTASPGAMTNLAGQPIAPTPMQAPNLPPVPQAPNAPAPTGTFQAPTPGTLSPAGQFRIDQANKGAQQSAAARGSLLSGGFQQELARLNQGIASEEYDKDFNRAATAHGLNLGTTRQNFDMSLGAFGADRQAYGDARDNMLLATDTINANSQAQDQYAQQMADYRASLGTDPTGGGMAQTEGAGMPLSAGPLAAPEGSRPSGRMAGYRGQYPQLADAWRRSPEAGLQSGVQWQRNRPILR